ncbi:subtilisin-like protein [Linnemannia elongata AG-77]|uniref:Subtilisin-like protein n=1 Tax=Linnemannia elongata AG-77 TaxID=1314771 RepID=A0A197JQV3_9FUNG|nr:subtilisin-like protein [Linnemannia elongata AG-77]
MKATLIVSALLAATTVVSAGRLHTPTPSNSQQLVRRSFIVEYDDHYSHSHFATALKRRQIEVDVHKEYEIFNGAAITLRSEEHSGEHLATLAGVKNVWPVTTYSLPHIREPHNPIEPFAEGVIQAAAVSNHNSTGVNVLHDSFNLTGAGIKVGVLDSGVDYNHPVFAIPPATKGCFAVDSPTCRFVKGWDFVGDAYTSSKMPVPGPDPMDRHGHGTHVAGIIGGNALSPTIVPRPITPWVGVAPGVTFGIYKVIGKAGVTTTEVLLSAMEMAYKDGMNIINMSLGGGSAYRDGPEAKLAETLTANGMVVISAAGNEGSDGVWMVSDLGLGDSTTSVASFDGAFATYNYFTYAGVNYPYQSSLIFQPSTGINNGIIPILSTLDGSLSSGCNPAFYSGVDLRGKYALVKYSPGECDSKIRQASFQAAGAIGFLVQALQGDFVGFAATAAFPIAGVDYASGLALIAAWKANPAGAFTWGGAATIEFPNPDGGGPSSFSSYGLDGELRSKPDVGAPGGKILSSYPIAQGGYSVLSGTSMATPYVVGANALYMESKRAKPLGADIRKVFKNTATFSRGPNSMIVDSALKQGAGLINVLNAVRTTSSITPDHIDLLDTVNFKRTTDITITNSGATAETYTLSHVAADTLNFYYVAGNPFPQGKPLVSKDQATVSFGSNQIQIAAGQSATVTLTFTEPSSGSASQFPLYSGFVVATPATAGAIAVQVPYTGMKGDVRQVPMMDTASGYPMLTMVSASGRSLVTIPRNAVFDLTRPNAATVPVVLTRLGSHTPDLTIRVYNDKNQFAGFMSSPSKGPAFGTSGRQMNLDAETNEKEYSGFDWEGEIYLVENATTTAHQIVPSGTYNIVVAAQKKFTKGTYPDDFEVYKLGSVTVKTNGPPLPELTDSGAAGLSAAVSSLGSLGVVAVTSVLMSLAIAVGL